jgi:hypothetical protein
VPTKRNETQKLMRIVNISNHSIRWLFAELVIVVLGISIAFQVEEFRNGLNEKDAERRMLQSMLDDFSVAEEQFQVYLQRVSEDFSAAINLYDYLKNKPNRSEEELIRLVRPLQFGYRWQATDSTWQSSSPERITNVSLRADLISFHDGRLPFMLNISTELQEARRDLLDALLDDIERIAQVDDYIIIKVVSDLDSIPSNPEFFETLGNFSIIVEQVENNIAVTLERISAFKEAITVHVSTL